VYVTNRELKKLLGSMPGMRNPAPLLAYPHWE
jgi:hypothetical protein